MNKEELIKNQFPNDEFLQAAVLRIVDKCVAELEKENAELKKNCEEYSKTFNRQNDEIVSLREEVADHERIMRAYEFYVWHNMKFFEGKELKE